jgi:hypothetical protein
MTSPNSRPKREYFGPEEPFVHCHDDTYYRQQNTGRCGVCGKRTHYKSLYAAEYCCSVECSNELWCDITERIATSTRSALRKRGK